MKLGILNLAAAAFLALPVAAIGKQSILKEWKFGEGTLKLVTLPENHGGQLGLWWLEAGDLQRSYYGGIEDLAKLIRVLEQIKERPPIAGGELKVHWDQNILVVFREKEVVFKFDNIGGFTASWNEAISLVKAIEGGRKKLNEDAGGSRLLDTKTKKSEQAAPFDGGKPPK